MGDHNRTPEAQETFKEKRRPKGEIKFNINLNEEQKEAKRLIIDSEIVIITGRAGCLGKGTKVLMYDGRFKQVEDIVVGDLLMGVDSTPRTVLSLNRGREQMYWVRQKRGKDYRVNASHILSLKKRVPTRFHKKTLNGKRYIDYSVEPIAKGFLTTENMSVSDYIKINRKKLYKGYIAPTINFEEQELKIDPYYFGLWAGDGDRRDIRTIYTPDLELIDYLCNTMEATKYGKDYQYKLPKGKYTDEFKELFKVNRKSDLEEKYIPDVFLYNSVDNRLKLLAGILDTDGYYSIKGKFYEVIQKNELLSNQIAFLCRSLGFKTNIRGKIATMKREDGSIYTCPVYRISIIIPNDLEIPTRVKRKKREEISDFKDRTLTGITIEEDIVDDYFGFTLDGDNLFILEDFTVTHNCGKTLIAAQASLDLLFKGDLNKVFITRPTQQMGDSLGFLPGSLTEKLDPYLDPFKENLYQCYDRAKVDTRIMEGQIEGFALQFARGKNLLRGTMLVCDESQNTTKHQMLGLLTRLGKGGRIIIVGDNEQKDIKDEYNGLSYAIELSKKIPEIKWIKLKENHRSDLVGKILDYEYKG